LNTRLTYIQTELLEKYAWIKGDRVDTILSHTRIHSQTNFNILSIIKILYPLSKEQNCFSDLFKNSKIRLKRSFLRYLNFCIEIGMIEKISEKRGINRFYSITEKGRLFLEMFSN